MKIRNKLSKIDNLGAAHENLLSKSVDVDNRKIFEDMQNPM
jgi:hypothetical protein